MAAVYILVAEDRDDDIELLRQAFFRAAVKAELRFVRNGRQTIDYLKGERGFENRTLHPLPTVLLLDLNMPVLDGFAVLEWLRLQPAMRRLMVVVFTSSEDPEQVNRAYELGAKFCIVKPRSFEKLHLFVGALEQWLNANLCLDGLSEPADPRLTEETVG